MISRSTLFSSPGGDTVQILNTAKYLQALNVVIDIRLSNDIIDYSEYDLIHFFNIIRPADILSHIEKSTIPFVVSTIYVDYSEYEKSNRKGFLGFAFKFLSPSQIEYIKFLARHFFNKEGILNKKYLHLGHYNSIKNIVRQTTLLLPNSENEYCRFSHDFIIDKEYAVIPNAVDTSLFDSSLTPDPNYLDQVICVARIEGRKNQLKVIKAVIQTDLPLSIIGQASPNHKSYFDDCKQAAYTSTKIKFISQLKQSELASIYKAAKVHVLASWFETTGLSTLEAALLGCNVVITDKGDTRDYFKDYAFYCDPLQVNSIAYAIQAAYDAPFPEELRNHILTHYTWEITAEKTLRAYNQALQTSVTFTSI